MQETNLRLFALTAKTIQVQHIVQTVNSRSYKLKQFEKLTPDCWLICYEGLELIPLAKNEDFVVSNIMSGLEV